MGLVFRVLHLYIQDRKRQSLVSLGTSISVVVKQDLGVTKPFLFFSLAVSKASSLPPVFTPVSRGQRVLAAPLSCSSSITKSPSLVQIWSGLPLYSRHHSCSGATFGDGVSPARGSAPRSTSGAGYQGRRFLALPFPAEFVFLKEKLCVRRGGLEPPADSIPGRSSAWKWLLLCNSPTNLFGILG